MLIDLYFFNARPTNDNFHSYVIVNLDIPTNVPDFEDKLRRQLQDYHTIGKQTASLDDDFYFRSILGKFFLETISFVYIYISISKSHKILTALVLDNASVAL